MFNEEDLLYEPRTSPFLPSSLCFKNDSDFLGLTVGPFCVVRCGFGNLFPLLVPRFSFLGMFSDSSSFTSHFDAIFLKMVSDLVGPPEFMARTSALLDTSPFDS